MNPSRTPNSETDIPMLESVGHAYAVNADRQLAKAAHEVNGRY